MTRSLICSIVWSLALAGAAKAANVTPAFPNLLAFDSPINIEDPGDGTDRLFVVERAGQVYVFANNPTVSQRSRFIDISSRIELQGECGLLGLAFHPNFEQNRFFYLFYVRESPFQSVISRFTASAVNPNFADPATEVPLLTVSQNGFFHKGGCIVLLGALVPKVLEFGIQEAEFSWVLETNTLSRASLEKGGAKLYKTYRMYDGEV